MDVNQFVNQRFEGLTTQSDGAWLAGAEFEECTFVGCDLTEASLRGARFYDCQFQRSELALASLADVTLRDVAFKNCRLTGVDFTQLTRDPLGIRVTFTECDLGMALFRRLDLTGFTFDGCRLDGAEFERCKLTSVDFSGSDLEKCRFEGCDLREADLRGARNYIISPSSNQIAGMRVSLPEAIGLLAAIGVVVE